jgi:hypothetical protein
VLIVGSVEFVLSLVGVAAGVIAIVIGVVGIGTGLAGSKNQIDTVKGVNAQIQETLAELRGEVETHYIGKFPDFMPNIVSVIESATKELTMFCDLPAYGVVSNPTSYIKYRNAIQDKVQDEAVEVRILHLDAPARRALLDAQFGDSWQSNTNVRSFLQRRGRDAKAVTKGEFLDLIETEQRNALEGLKLAPIGRGSETTETHAIMPMYFWIADSRRAVLVLTQFDRTAHEVAFLTTSENLIKAMCGIFNRYLAAARHEAAEHATGGSATGDGEVVEQRE